MSNSICSLLDRQGRFLDSLGISTNGASVGEVPQIIVINSGDTGKEYPSYKYRAYRLSNYGYKYNSHGVWISPNGMRFYTLDSAYDYLLKGDIGTLHDKCYEKFNMRYITYNKLKDGGSVNILGIEFYYKDFKKNYSDIDDFINNYLSG